MGAGFYTYHDLDRMKLPAVSTVVLVTDDGQEIELHYRRSDGEITVSANHRLVITPWATNVIRVRSEK